MRPLTYVHKSMTLRIGFAILLAGTSMLAADFDRILIPVFASVAQPGAFGSLWGTEMVIRNDSADQIPLFPPECSPLIPPRFCNTPELLPPFRTLRMTRFQGPDSGPLMLNVPRGSGDRILASLRVIDLSRTAEQYGTSIPVVRERDLRTGSVQILDVPNGAGLRSSLRVFDFDSREESSFEVRAYAVETEDLLSAMTFHTFGVPQGRPPGVEITQPG